MSKSDYGEFSYNTFIIAYNYVNFTILGYIKDLLSELFVVHRTGGNKGRTKKKHRFPQYLCSNFDRPNKVDAIKQKQTRFAM